MTLGKTFDIFHIIANLKIKCASYCKKITNISTQTVAFKVWFMCSLVFLFFFVFFGGRGSYVCKFVCQFLGWGFCLVVGLSAFGLVAMC